MKIIKELIFFFGLTILILLILESFTYFFSTKGVILSTLAFLLAKNLQHSWHIFNKEEDDKKDG